MAHDLKMSKTMMKSNMSIMWELLQVAHEGEMGVIKPHCTRAGSITCPTLDTLYSLHSTT